MIKAEIGGIFTFNKKWRFLGSLILLLASVSILSDVYLEHKEPAFSGWDYYMIFLGAGNLFLAITGIIKSFNPPFLAVHNKKLLIKPSVFFKVKEVNIDEFVDNTSTILSILADGKKYKFSYGLFDFKNMGKLRQIQEYIFEQKSVDIAEKDLRYEQ